MAGDRDDLLRFLKLADRLKSVYRAAYLSDQTRHESVAEHTWHMCVIALLLGEEVKPALDLERVFKLIVVHDLVEVHANDTYAHDLVARYEAADREEKAAQVLFAVLPPRLRAELLGCWEEFEAAQTPEARFARALDRLQAFAQNVFADGRIWRERSVTEEMSRRLNAEAMAFDEGVAEIFELLYQSADLEGLWAENGRQAHEEATRYDAS